MAMLLTMTTKQRNVINKIKRILKDEGFELKEQDTIYTLYDFWVDTPFGVLGISVHGDGGIFTRFKEHDRIPQKIKESMGVSRVGKWNFMNLKCYGDHVELFRSMFRRYITTEKAWKDATKAMEEDVVPAF